MRKIKKAGIFTGNGAIVILAAALFTVCLLGFTLLHYDVPLPVLRPTSNSGIVQSSPAPAQVAAPGNWATGLLNIEVPGFGAQVNKLTASLDDPDWPMPDTTSTQSAGSSDVTPIITTKAGPVIMLYSTHSDESFLKVTGEVYNELANSNTTNKNYNILKVNQALSTLLANTYHLPIYFNDTDHEQGKYYTTSYERSLVTIQNAMKTYPSLAVFFDIHRDSAGSASKDDSITVDGKKCAHVMFVVGTGEGRTGTGFAVKPNWQKHKALADLLTAEINKLAPGLCQPVRINPGRYNQQVSDAALAIEIGNDKNTLEEALNAVPYLAQAIDAVMTKDLDIEPLSVP